MSPIKLPYSTIMARSLKLKCPRCGQTRLFRGWFAMHDECAECGLKFNREPGFFLGSVYINYGLTALLMSVTYTSLLVAGYASNNTLLWSMLVFCVLFPLWFFRYARSLWMGFDHFWDPTTDGPGGGPNG